MTNTTNFVLGSMFYWLLPFATFIMLYYFIYKRMSGGTGFVKSFGKNKACEIQGEFVGVRHKDVGGVEEIINFLKDLQSLVCPKNLVLFAM